LEQPELEAIVDTLEMALLGSLVVWLIGDEGMSWSMTEKLLPPSCGLECADYALGSTFSDSNNLSSDPFSLFFAL
jgi:hypothetical protein